VSADRLDEITRRLREFSDQRDWSQFHNPKNLAMLIASEAGELLAELRWISGDESDQMLANQDVRTKVKHEIADILIGVLIFCDRTGIDLWRAIEEKIEINQGNYPPSQRGMPTRKKS
jgi:NTP pyrophosphatase (non-canonical NTP hydrolase)